MKGETTQTSKGGPSAATASGPDRRVVPQDDYIPFPTNHLPDVVRRFVEETAAATSNDAGYVALPALALLGAAIGTTHCITPKGGWIEPPFIWGVCVGTSGSGKSPAFKPVMHFADEIDQGLVESNRARDDAYRQAYAAWKRSGGDGPEPERPAYLSFRKADLTIEAAASWLKDNPRGGLVARDEAAAFFHSFGRYAKAGSSGDCHNWIELWEGGR